VRVARRAAHRVHRSQICRSRTVNDCDIYYETNGNGPDVVFIHGEDHGIEMFEHQVARFSEQYRCIAYDRRGHGRSQLPAYGYSLRNQMLDLAGLLDHLEIRHPVLLAVAMATTIATSYALEYPDRLRALVLASWYELDGYPLMERRRQKHAVTFAQLHMKMYEILCDRGLQGLIDHMQKEGEAFLPILPKSPEVRERVIRMMSSHSPEHYVKAAEFYTSMPNLVPRLREIACPILGVCGDDDPSPDNPELLAGAKNFTEVWIAGARRFSMLENPQAFNSALAHFLATLP
jgi:3-oxoadipate enol-lactonase